MNERPILFSAPMVRAILEGRKTQTRRILKHPWNPEWTLAKSFRDGRQDRPCWIGYINDEVTADLGSGYGEPGDRLWVRETHAIFSVDGSYVSVGYKARLPEGKTLADTDGGLDVIPVYDREQVCWAEKHIDADNWRPSIYMPRWASRITLEVTGIRVERLQDISEADAEAEGMTDDDDPFWRPTYADPDSGGYPSFRNSFQFIWESINGAKSWSANPWVWVVEFKRMS